MRMCDTHTLCAYVRACACVRACDACVRACGTAFVLLCACACAQKPALVLTSTLDTLGHFCSTSSTRDEQPPHTMPPTLMSSCTRPSVPARMPLQAP